MTRGRSPGPGSNDGGERRDTPRSALLAAVRADYATTLPGKLEALAQRVLRARDAVDDGAAMRDARTSAHRLWGTAGCYGFREVGLAARRIEEALRFVATADAAAERAGWAHIERLLADARRAAADAAGAAPAPTRKRQSS